jgi:hypothetical protein
MRGRYERSFSSFSFAFLALKLHWGFSEDRMIELKVSLYRLYKDAGCRCGSSAAGNQVQDIIVLVTVPSPVQCVMRGYLLT